MNEPGPPTAEGQLAFLRSLQRLLDEGSFVSSYKFALLHAIADLCLVKGDDSGAELDLSTSEIAEQFVRLYWPQVAPFVAGDDKQILSQNTGRQAAIVRELAGAIRPICQGSLAELEKESGRLGPCEAQGRANGEEDAALEVADRRVRTLGLPVRERRCRCGRSARARGRLLLPGILSNGNRHDRGSVVPLRPATQPSSCWARSSIYGRSSSGLDAAALEPRTVLCSWICSSGRCFYCEPRHQVGAGTSTTSSPGDGTRWTWDTTSFWPTRGVTRASRTC